MRVRVPGEARAVLEGGAFCYVGVRTWAGPHVTPLVYALDGARIWVTTARRSVKARAWRSSPYVAGLVLGEDASVVFRGTVRSYDALDPFTWPAAAVSATGIARAAAKFSLKNARFFAGYAVDAGRVPLAWTPPARVFAGIELTAGRVIENETGHSIARWGEWPQGVRYRAAFARLPATRSMDLGVPAGVRKELGQRGEGALGLESPSTLTILPVGWRRVASQGSYQATLPAELLKLSDIDGSAPASLTIDIASTWRASAMKGVLLQGPAAAFEPAHARRGRKALADLLEEGEALVRMRPRRVVWWEGWASATVGVR